MANVYATLADGGYRNTPIAITKVVFPDGHVDDSWGKPHRVKVLSDGVTSEETNILHENVLEGTATTFGDQLSRPPPRQEPPANLMDAWLDGYMPNYSTVVWMGYPKQGVPMTDVHGEPQQGGYLPAEIWHAYMAAVTEGEPCTEFPSATEPISYQPFFGKFATTGRVSTSESPKARWKKQHSQKQNQPKTGKSTPGEHGTATPKRRRAPVTRESNTSTSWARSAGARTDEPAPTPTHKATRRPSGDRRRRTLPTSRLRASAATRPCAAGATLVV